MATPGSSGAELPTQGGKGLPITIIVPYMCNVSNHGRRVPDFVIHRRIFKIGMHANMLVGT